jgi:hypothetical protein
MEERTEAVNTFVTHLYCDCGGKMNWTGKELPGQPVRFEYQCEQCRIRHYHSTRFPYITHRPRKKLKKSGENISS